MADRIVAFARAGETGTTVTVVCKAVVRAVNESSIAIPRSFWQHTSVVIPPQLQLLFSDALKRRTFAPAEQIAVEDLFDPLPVAFFAHDASAK